MSEDRNPLTPFTAAPKNPTVSVPTAKNPHKPNASDLLASPTKRLRVTDPSNAYFHHMKLNSASEIAVEELTEHFQAKFPSLTRAFIADLFRHHRASICESFVILEVLRSLGQCIFDGETRWLFLCQEILPDGTRGKANRLTINSYLPDMTTELSDDLKLETDWADPTRRPVIVLSGFSMESGKYPEDGWNPNLICRGASDPRILIGTAPELAVPAGPVMVRNFRVGYTLLGDLDVSEVRYNVMAVVKSFYPFRIISNGQTFIQSFLIMDPSLASTDHHQTPFIKCVVFSHSSEKLPPFQSHGDVIIIRGLQVVLYHQQRQLRLHHDSTSFAVLDSQSFASRPYASTAVAETDIPRIDSLRGWYEKTGRALADGYNEGIGREKGARRVLPVDLAVVAGPAVVPCQSVVAGAAANGDTDVAGAIQTGIAGEQSGPNVNSVGLTVSDRVIDLSSKILPATADDRESTSETVRDQEELSPSCGDTSGVGLENHGCRLM